MVRATTRGNAMIIPYDDVNPTDRKPYLTWTLIALNVGIFFLTLDWLTLPPDERVAMYRQHGALIPAEPELADFVTSMFLHGSVSHLVGNMLFLWITGDNIEDEFGPTPYALFYVSAGVLAAFAHLITVPQSTTPMLGASGAISGVMGAYIVLFPHSRIKIFYWLWFFVGTTRIRAIWWLGLWIGFQVVSGAAAGASGSGVAYTAHIGGFVVGVAAAFVGKQIGWLEGEEAPEPGRLRR